MASQIGHVRPCTLLPSFALESRMEPPDSNYRSSSQISVGSVAPMATTRKRGRPARIDTEAIADATLEIGISHATMRQVADRLGISLPGLYHHVKGKEDLLRIATLRALELVPRPQFDGVHWDTWLRDWANFIRVGFAEHPELLEQYMKGSVGDDQMGVVSEALDVLCGLGLDVVDAFRVFAAVTNLALGDTVYEIRERVLTETGRPWTDRLDAFVAADGPDQHVTLQRLGRAGALPSTQEAFDAQCDYLLAGIAARHDLPVSIADRLIS